MPLHIIFLVGYMGSGKTTTGQLLAEKLNWKFIDLDKQIEEKNKASIADLFHEFGENYFRKAEQEALYSTINFKNVVVATGGGCAAFSDNMKWMNEHGTTIYLRCRPGVLFHRIARQKSNRPLLAGKEDVEIMEYILESIKQRLPYYAQAQHTISGEDKPEKIVSALSKLLSPPTTSFSPD